MNRVASFVVPFVLAAAIALATSPAAQAAPPAPQPVTLPCATDISIQVLGNAQPAAAEGQTLVLVRAMWAPGGGIGPHTHPGTLVISVESGQFGFTLAEDQMAGEMTVMRSGEPGTPAVPEPMTPGQEVVLEPGDWVVETGMVHSARAVGDEPVSVVFSGLATTGQPLTTCVE
jgi:quercetin dioxygenase-like cupin family protein